MRGNQVTEAGYYWVRKDCFSEWSLLQVEAPAQCHADCGIGNWEFIKIDPPSPVKNEIYHAPS